MSFYGSYYEKTTKDYNFSVTVYYDGSPAYYQLEVSSIKNKKENKFPIFSVEESEVKGMKFWFENFCTKFQESEFFRSQVGSFESGDSFKVISGVSKDNSNLSTEISNFLLIPKKSLKFKDFANLKSGRDKYTTMKGSELFNLIDNSDLEKIKELFTEEKYILSAIRWVLRGLTLDLAISKVKVDIDIASKMNR